MSGYAIIRRGLLDHLLEGRLGFFELGIYTTIHLQADFQTGVWRGSAPRLLATAPAGTTLREVQRAVQILVKIGFLRTFQTHGSRGNYAVLIDKYDVRIGALKGRRLNAAKSVSWREPFYEPCAERDAEANAEAAPSQYSVSKKQKKAAKAAATFSSPTNIQAWIDIGLSRPEGSPDFRNWWEAYWTCRNGRSLSAVMKEAVDGWENEGGTVPAPFFKQLAIIREQERLENEPKVAYGPRRPAVVL